MALKLYKPELMTEKQVAALGADLSKNNKYITETAGFVPLDVKLRRFQEAGQLMQFHNAEFTSADMREAYFSPDFEINPEDDYEEIQEKLQARQKFLADIKAAKSNGVNEPPTAAEAGTGEPETATEPTKDIE